jgi:hypothetical protein
MEEAIMKKCVSLSLQSLAAAGVVAMGLASAPARADVYVEVAPPAPRVEVVPVPRRGYVWAPGYWAWRGRNHVWVEGHWVPARTGFRWEPDTWYNDGGRWRYFRGHWVKDY